MLKVVIGLPGCGKTTRLSEMQAAGFRIFDDFHANAFGDSPDAEMSQHYFSLMDALMADQDCAVSDVAFCDPSRRSAFLKAVMVRFPKHPMEWIYFENAPEKCRQNILRRNSPDADRELKALAELAPKYVIPAGATIVPVSSDN
jgi:hypothetical protein